MAESSNSIPAPAANPVAFDPAAWLSRFESIGGGFLATETQVSICVAYQDTTRNQQAAANAMLADLPDDHRAAVIAHIRLLAGRIAAKPDLNAILSGKISEPDGTAPRSSGTAVDDNSKRQASMDMTHAFTSTDLRAAWDAAMALYQEADADYDRHSDQAEIPAEIIDRVRQTFLALMNTPAPDESALRWKLNDLLEDVPGSIGTTLADLDRFFPTASSIPGDPIWSKFISDYRAKYDACLVIAKLQDDFDFDAACSLLSPEPPKPNSGFPGDILNMTIREIRAAGDTPAQKAAWADYERNHTAWKAQKDALHEQIFGLSEATYDQAYSARSDAFNALTTYHITNLHDLGDKIEIIAKDYAGFEIPQEYVAGILADVRRLAAPAPNPRDVWDAAMARYHGAETRMNTESGDAGGNAFIDAETALLDTRAPDLQAMRWKVERFHEMADDTVIDAKDFERLLSDIDHLLGDAGHR